MNRQMVVHVSFAQVLARKRYGDILIRTNWVIWVVVLSWCTYQLIRPWLGEVCLSK